MVVMVSSKVSSRSREREGFRRPSDREDIDYRGRGQLGLLKILCDAVVANPDAEFDAKGEPRRPVVRVLYRVYDLARLNHQPITRDIRRRNQGSGFFGRILPSPEQFAGCLLGQCLGDALGFVVEGALPHECREYVEEILKNERAGERVRAPFAFGQYSNDSQLARELLRSFEENKGRFNSVDYAKRIAAIFAAGRIVGAGRSTEQAARRLVSGVAWEEAGTPPPVADSGSAVRAGPVGLMFFDDPERMIEAARNQGRITHQDPRCVAGSVAVAGAVALAATSERIEPGQFLGELVGWVQQVDEPTANSISQLMGWVALRREGAAGFIIKLGTIGEQSAEEDHGITPFITSSVLWGLYSFLTNPDDYWETICTAIAVGGDVDTTAAMAGAMSGAFLGKETPTSGRASAVTQAGAWLTPGGLRCFGQTVGSSVRTELLGPLQGDLPGEDGRAAFLRDPVAREGKASCALCLMVHIAFGHKLTVFL